MRAGPRWRETPGHRHVFRFYHPEMVVRLARNAGFTLTELRTGDSRLAEIELCKPARVSSDPR